MGSWYRSCCYRHPIKSGKDNPKEEGKNRYDLGREELLKRIKSLPKKAMTP